MERKDERPGKFMCKTTMQSKTYNGIWQIFKAAKSERNAVKRMLKATETNIKECNVMSHETTKLLLN